MNSEKKEESATLTGHAAFREIQRVLVVLKAQYNEHGKYYYRSLEDINIQLKPLLARYNMSLIYSDDIKEVANNAYVHATATLGDEHGVLIASASSVARDAMSTAGNISLAPIATNAASSFARKQAVSGLFLLDDSSMVAMSGDEQKKAEKVAEEVSQADEEKRAEAEANLMAEIEEFASESVEQIKKSLSLTELTAVYKALWRESKQYGDNVVTKIEQAYFDKKDALKKEEK